MESIYVFLQESGLPVIVDGGKLTRNYQPQLHCPVRNGTPVLPIADDGRNAEEIARRLFGATAVKLCDSLGDLRSRMREAGLRYYARVEVMGDQCSFFFSDIEMNPDEERGLQVSEN